MYVKVVEIDIWSIWQSEVGRDGRMKNRFPWVHITTGELRKALCIKCWKSGCYLWVHTFLCKTEGYFGWRILHSSGVNNGRMCEKQRFITRTISSLCTLCECTLSLMLYCICNYFRKLNIYTFRRFLLSTPVNFLFNTAVIFSPLRKEGFTFPLHKPNIMSGMRFPAFTFNLSPPVTKPSAKISMF